MKIRSNVKAGPIALNHNEKLESNNKPEDLIAKTGVKAGGIQGANHNEKLASDRSRNLLVKTGIKAGAPNGPGHNHNEKLADDNSHSIEQKKSIGKKLRLSKETIRILKDGDLKAVAGGQRASMITQATTSTLDVGVGCGC